MSDFVKSRMNKVIYIRRVTYKALGVPVLINYKNDADKIISFTIVFQITLLASKNIFATTLYSIFLINNYLNIAVYVIMGIIFLNCLINMHRSFKMDQMVLIVLIFVFWLITFLVVPDMFYYKYITNTAKYFVVYCLPIFMLLPLLKSTDYLLEYFYRASYIIAISAIICAAAIIAGAQLVGDYSMSYGKAAMVSSIILFSKFYRQKKSIDLALAVIVLMCILIFGSRYPVLCIFVYATLGFIKSKLWDKKGIIFIALILIAVPVFFINYELILMAMLNMLDKIGISSRTLSLLINDSITGSYARDMIHLQLIEKLNGSPYLGYGAFGGIIALKGELPHNLFLDIYANFGYIFGSFVLFFLIWKTLYYAIKKRNNSFGELVLIYACMVWPPATVAGGFWGSDKLWILISLFLAYRNLTTGAYKYLSAIRKR